MKPDALLHALLSDFEGLALADVSELPYGTGENYLVPYVLTRSAVFSSKTFKGKATRPIITQRTELGTYGKVSVYQLLGPVLDGYERDVFQEVVKLAIEKDGRVANGTIRVQFEANEMLRRLKREIGGGNRAWLAERLQFLNGAQFAVESSVHPDKIIGTHLLHKVVSTAIRKTEKQKGNVLYTVLLDESLARVFYMGWSVVNAQVYHNLANDKSAQALFAFYSTHREPKPLNPVALQSILGRGSQRFDRFLAETLRPALEKLKQATGWPVCTINDDGKVEVQKSAPKSAATSNKAAKAMPSLKAVQAVPAEPAPVALGAPAAVGAWLQARDAGELRAILRSRQFPAKLGDDLAILRERVLLLFTVGLSLADAQQAVEAYRS